MINDLLSDMSINLKSKIIKDEYTDICNSFFDVKVDDYSTTEIIDNLVLPKEWKIGVIYGGSGTGKTTLLKKHFGEPFSFEWDKEKAVISNFTHITPVEASKILCAVGLSSVPVWLRPFYCLSNGEQFRANMAMAISKNDLIIIDEYTSVVNRNVAIAMSNSIQKYIRNNTNKKIVLSSCHSDILNVLRPDWIYNPENSETLYNVENFCKKNRFSINKLQLGDTIGELIIE